MAKAKKASSQIGWLSHSLRQREEFVEASHSHPSCACLRYERGGFAGGGNTRWVEDSRDDDWSKPTAPNERLEQ